MQFTKDRITVFGLAALMIATMAIIAHHPVAHGSSDADRLASVLAQGSADQMVHGSVMGILLLLGAIMAGVSRRLGQAGPAVQTALLAFQLAIGMGFVAMTFDGFIIPAISHSCEAATPDCLGSTALMFKSAGFAVQAFTRIGLYLIAGATALWSLVMLAKAGGWRIAGGVGVVSTMAQLVLLTGVIGRLTPQTLLLELAAQLVWYVTLAWTIMTGRAAEVTAREGKG